MPFESGTGTAAVLGAAMKPEGILIPIMAAVLFFQDRMKRLLLAGAILAVAATVFFIPAAVADFFIFLHAAVLCGAAKAPDYPQSQR